MRFHSVPHKTWQLSRFWSRSASWLPQNSGWGYIPAKRGASLHTTPLVHRGVEWESAPNKSLKTLTTTADKHPEAGLRWNSYNGYDLHKISFEGLTNADNDDIILLIQYPSFAQANTVSEFSHARSLYVFGHFCSSASSNRCTLLGTLEGEIPPGICQLNMMTTPSL